MSGTELCAGVSSYFTRVGSFMADGKGNITSGLEDINVCPGVGTLSFTSGKYSVGPDGRGILNLTNSTGTTNYSIVLSSTAAGSIAQTDTAASASGPSSARMLRPFPMLRLPAVTYLILAAWMLPKAL